MSNSYRSSGSGFKSLATALLFTSVSFSICAQDREALGKSFVSRRVQVDARREALFSKSLVAKGEIDLKGNNVSSDSFDSTNPAASTDGKYDATKRGAKGDIATNSGLVNSLEVGNAKILGTVSTGPGGTIAIGPNGSVGDEAWIDAGRKGIMPGHSTDDMNVSFPEVTPPFTGGASSPRRNVVLTNLVNGVLKVVTYDYYLESGNYQVSALSGSVYVGGNANLYVTSAFDCSRFDMALDANVKLYVAAPEVRFSGNSAINPGGKALNFQYYGLPSNRELTFTGNASFTGVIYAPNADFHLGGGGNNSYDFVGAGIAKTVNMHGHFKFHYDESLQSQGPERGFVAINWNEQLAAR